MKKNILILLFSLTTLLSYGQDSAKYVGWSIKIFEQLKSNDFQSIVEQIDTSGRQSNLDSARLGTAWRNLLKRVGKLKGTEDTTYTHQPSYDVVVLRVQFDEKQMDIKTVFSSKGTLKGIFFLPASQ